MMNVDVDVDAYDLLSWFQRSAKGKRNEKKSNLVENPKFPQCPSPKVPVQTLVP